MTCKPPRPVTLTLTLTLNGARESTAGQGRAWSCRSSSLRLGRAILGECAILGTLSKLLHMSKKLVPALASEPLFERGYVGLVLRVSGVYAGRGSLYGQGQVIQIGLYMGPVLSAVHGQGQGIQIGLW